MYRKPIHRLLEAILHQSLHISFSALEDVSFTVSTGSTLGIIGENGAGKSTLLKILARTLYPSAGDINIRGRVAALLELGAGFHIEFTGRQNIYLNASLMGLSDSEIKSKEKEIIDFAEISDFIDQPIKTYSSGMIVRLAFSIATSVDPDILVVDEALSVGDQRFQEKCIARMLAFRNAGKTIIVCSHSVYLINELCENCIWLEKGRVRENGPTSEVVSKYLACLEDRKAEKKELRSNRIPEVRVDRLLVCDQRLEVIDHIKQFTDVCFHITTQNNVSNHYGHLVLVMESGDGEPLFSTTTRDVYPNGIHFTGTGYYSLTMPRVVLQKGVVWIRGMITNQDALRIVDQRRFGPFHIISDHPEYGLMWMEHHWNFERQGSENGKIPTETDVS